MSASFCPSNGARLPQLSTMDLMDKRSVLQRIHDMVDKFSSTISDESPQDNTTTNKVDENRVRQQCQLVLPSHNLREQLKGLGLSDAVSHHHVQLFDSSLSDLRDRFSSAALKCALVLCSSPPTISPALPSSENLVLDLVRSSQLVFDNLVPDLIIRVVRLVETHLNKHHAAALEDSDDDEDMNLIEVKEEDVSDDEQNLSFNTKVRDLFLTSRPHSATNS